LIFNALFTVDYPAIEALTKCLACAKSKETVFKDGLQFALQLCNDAYVSRTSGPAPDEQVNTSGLEDANLCGQACCPPRQGK
jgi:hypothetical protein